MSNKLLYTCVYIHVFLYTVKLCQDFIKEEFLQALYKIEKKFDVVVLILKMNKLKGGHQFFCLKLGLIWHIHDTPVGYTATLVGYWSTLVAGV